MEAKLCPWLLVICFCVFFSNVDHLVSICLKNNFIFLLVVPSLDFHSAPLLPNIIIFIHCLGIHYLLIVLFPFPLCFLLVIVAAAVAGD